MWMRVCSFFWLVYRSLHFMVCNYMMISSAGGTHQEWHGSGHDADWHSPGRPVTGGQHLPSGLSGQQRCV